jgi:dipeptidyl aminopeptidase/acylaminoacyl peptidase
MNIRRPWIVLAFFAGSFGAVPAEGAGAEPSGPKRPSRLYTIEQFLDTTQLRGASFSADESRILFSSDRTGIFNAYTVPVAGGEPSPGTRSAVDSTFSVSFFPGDDRILFTHDRGGDENNHLYVIRDGREQDLTPGKALKARFMKWTRDNAAFYIQTNERDAKFFDIYRVEADGYARTLVYKDEVGYQAGDISDDGRWIAFSKPRTTSDSDIFLWDVAKRLLTRITPHQGQATHQPAEFDRQSRALYYITNDGGEFTRVRKYDLASGAHEDVERADWDILSTEFSHDGKYRVSTINVDGSTVVKVWDTRTGKPVEIPNLSPGEITSVEIARSERLMAFYLDSDRSPANLYVYRFGDPAPRRLTTSLSPAIDPDDLVDSEVVRFKSFDGTTIPSIFYKPHQAAPTQKVPALVWVHGGPGGQTRKGYNELIQCLVNHGYAVLGINNRGSSGYGRTFFTADDRKHGREPLDDCVEGKRYLASLPFVDPDRIGIVGGSYGGYMTLAALAFRPEAFAVGVDIFGVSNWLRTLESIPPYWESFREALYTEIGDPRRDRDMLREISPVFHADRIRKPLLVLQGANDPRVIRPESDDIVAALKKNGVPVEYVVFPDEGHGFTKKKNRIAGDRAILEFLDKHLRPADRPAPAGYRP